MKPKNGAFLLGVGVLSSVLGLSAIHGSLFKNNNYVQLKATDSYTLTINYLKKSDNSQVAAPHVEQLSKGTKYSVNSPSVSDLIPLLNYVKGRIFADETINVYYEPFDAWDGTESSALSGSGTLADPYQINSAEDLAYLATHTTTTTAWSGQYISLNTSVSLSGHNWEPIATGNHGKGTGSFVSWFCGNFNGNNHVIADMTCSGTSTTIYGLFSGIKNGSVENLYLSGSINTKSRGGSICYVAKGVVSFKNINTTVTQHYTTEGMSGGIYGLGNTDTNTAITVENCNNYGNITLDTAKSFIGGICGGYDTVGGTYRNSNNYGDIITAGYQTGGIFGGSTKACTFENCNNYGDVTSSYAGTANNPSVGGIAGRLAAISTIDDCNNYGDISSSTTQNGGIIGLGGSVAHVLTNVSNHGAISGTTNIGGIVGEGKTSVISNAVNRGDVSGTSNVAGIVGEGKKCVISNAVNRGDVSGTSNVAGIAGNGSTIDMTDVVNYGNISGTAGNVAGVCGTFNETANINGASNYGNVETTGTSVYCGLVVGYHGIGSNITIKSTDRIKGTLFINGVQSYSAFGYTNCVEVRKWYNGSIYSYEALQPGETYNPSAISPEVTSGYKVSDWYADDTLQTRYVATSYGTSGTNGNNALHVNIYAKEIKLYVTLLAEIEAANTCTEYNKASMFREDISYLDAQEQTDILDEIVDGTYTVEEKLEYMEYLYFINVTSSSSSRFGVDSFNNASIIIVSLLAVTGIVSLSILLSIKKKKVNE